MPRLMTTLTLLPGVIVMHAMNTPRKGPSAFYIIPKVLAVSFEQAQQHFLHLLDLLCTNTSRDLDLITEILVRR